MFELFESPYFYYATIGLQAICAIHCLRKGNQQKWIWLIVCLPIIGSIAYLYTEMFTRNQVQNIASGVGAVLQPSGRIRKLEEQLRFTDTFNNRVALADAYLAGGFTEKAIALYESSLTGAFTENEHVLMQLIAAYTQVGQFDKIVPIGNKLRKTPQFGRSRAHLQFALALEKTGHSDLAEKEFQTMKGKFSNYESRYEYGLFLGRAGRFAEAKQLLGDIVEEIPHLNGHEKREARQWAALAKEALKKADAVMQA